VASLKNPKRQPLEEILLASLLLQAIYLCGFWLWFLAVSDIHAVAGVPCVACVSSVDDVSAFTAFLFIAYV
jgi:hypothetical protein